MVRVSPSQFKGAFLKALPTYEENLVTCWSEGCRQYTAAIRKLLPGLAANLALHLYNGDYYTLDAIFYEERDTEHFSREVTYAKYIAIALEHENNFAGTFIELNKLQLFNAPLKVLVTYPDKVERVPKLLHEYARIIEMADVFGDISTCRQQLVVFGSYACSKTSWAFYVYQNGTFVAI